MHMQWYVVALCWYVFVWLGWASTLPDVHALPRRVSRLGWVIRARVWKGRVVLGDRSGEVEFEMPRKITRQSPRREVAIGADVRTLGCSMCRFCMACVCACACPCA